MKKILQNKYSKISIIIFLFLITGGLYLNSQASNFTWLQNSWIGGQSGMTATHSTDANGTWTNYSAKDADLNINGSGDVELKKANNWQETTDADFNSNTSKDSTLAVNGNSIKLLKADGATCSVAGDCQSNTCTGNVCVAAFTCGTSTISDIDGNTYNTVAIGSQCWTRENMMTTKYPDGTSITRGPVGATWNGSDNGYYAYPPNVGNTAEETLSNITTNKLGFAYQWSAAMHGSTTAGAQGICPANWHIPTHDEYTTLERAVCTSGTCATDFPFDTTTTGFRGTDEGAKLRTVSVTTFSGLLSGYRGTDGSFNNRSLGAAWWSATEYSASNAWSRYLSSQYAVVPRFPYAMTLGLSVRCVHN